MLAIAHTSLQKAKPAAHLAHDLRLFETPALMQSGDLKVFVHAQHRIALDSLSEITTWAQSLEEEVWSRLPSYKIVIHNMEAQNIDMTDNASMIRSVELLTNPNTGNGKLFESPSDIKRLRWSNEYRANEQLVFLVLELVKREQANEVLEQGIYWGGRHHQCEILELDHLLTRCNRCEHYGHKTVFCRGPLRCERCSGHHATLYCQNVHFRCPACAGPHSVQDPSCPAKMAIKNRIRQTRFSPDGDGILCASADLMLPPNMTTNTYTIQDIKASLTRPQTPDPLPRRGPAFPNGDSRHMAQQLRDIPASIPSQPGPTLNAPALDRQRPTMPALRKVPSGVPSGPRGEESANGLAERITQPPGSARRTTLAPVVPFNLPPRVPKGPKSHLSSKRGPPEATTSEAMPESRKRIKMEPTSPRSSPLSLYKF